MIAMLGIGMIALASYASAAGSTATATPSTALIDSEIITVQGNGFTPNTTVQIEQCAGTAANPPSDNTACDALSLDTQATADSTGHFVNASGDANGDTGYQVFTLGVPGSRFPNSTIRCDATHPCTLYVGDDQNNFAQPHTFVDVTFRTTLASTTTITTSRNPFPVGGSITFSATVAPASGTGTPTGTVQFRDGGAFLGTAKLLRSGQASLVTTTLPVGTHPISAQYSGSTVYGPSVSPIIQEMITADGSGTAAVSPLWVKTASTGDTLTFTYTPAIALTSGEVDIVVPSPWPVPSTVATASGDVTASSGTVSVTGRTIKVSGLSGSTAVSVVYGSKSGGGPGVTAPAAGSYVFPTSEKSTASGTVKLLTGSPKENVSPADGTGAASVSPTSVVNASSGDTLTFTYTPTGPLTNAEVDILVPAGWAPPSTVATAPGFVQAGAGTVSVSGQNIRVSALFGSSAVVVTFGSRTGGGPGLTAPAAGSYTFATSERSTPTGSVHPLATSPVVQVT